MNDRHPVLRWSNAGDKRVLYAGNQQEPVAWGEHTAGGWQFHVTLPGAPLELRRPNASRSAIEAYVQGVVEGWFRSIFA